jgi:hypothetical protein
MSEIKSLTLTGTAETLLITFYIRAIGGGIRLLDEWVYFDDPTPRLGQIRWLHPIEALPRRFVFSTFSSEKQQREKTFFAR